MGCPLGELSALRGHGHHLEPVALPAAFFAGYRHGERKLAPQLAQSRVQANQLQVRTVELALLRRRLVVQESAARLAQPAGERSSQAIRLLEEQVCRLQQELATYKEVLAPASARYGLRTRTVGLHATEEPRSCP